MEFQIEFYVSDSGHVPVREWLEGLKTQSPALHALTLAAIDKMRDRSYHRPPLSAHIQGDLYELRVGGRDIARVLYFTRKERRIVLLHGFVKKNQVLPRRELEVAQRRLMDYQGKHSDA